MTRHDFEPDGDSQEREMTDAEIDAFNEALQAEETATMDPDRSQHEADIGSNIADHESLLDVPTLREVMLDRIGAVIGRITRPGEVTAFDYQFIIEAGEMGGRLISRPSAVVYVAMRHVLLGQPNLWSIRSNTAMLAINAPDAEIEGTVRFAVEEVRRQLAAIRQQANGHKP